ncbi:cell division protein SepF [Priestia koreensis]|uniref:Cell division protein SepF n=1 Tax=Priestia koreensis TaxID=284581 RepID=A0A0M0KPH3_9BACI|nr:cell division protein SepF [Priestia koreensis]KOO40724.1 cell division protein SepF [Priestia koreensis]
MSIKRRFQSFFALDDETEYEEVEQERQPAQREAQREAQHPVPQQQLPAQQNQSKQQNVISLQSIQKHPTKMILTEPRAYSEAQEITDHLKAKKVVVVNLHRVARDQAVRIVDFLSGTVYALGGDIQKVGENIFLCTPDNVDVSGTISTLMAEQEQNVKRW